MVDVTEIQSRFEAAGQGHVLRHLEELSEADKESLLEQLAGIKVEELAGLLKSALADGSSSEEGENIITPFSQTVGRTTDESLHEESRRLGMDAIGRGDVAALVLAGGQGTRLGFTGPKGMYDIGLPSGRSLFQLFCERISKIRSLAAASSSSTSSAAACASAGGSLQSDPPSLPFYIMTSPINHNETTEFLESKNYFGLPKEDVKCFAQGMLPCLTNEGKIIMESPGKVSMAPDGNGGIYPSLLNSGMLQDMELRGIKHIHVFSIDNSLTKPADPVFIGYCLSKGADCGNKVVWKASPGEKVGVIAEKSGKPCVVEYSEISTEMAERTDGDGRLAFGAGNICNHYYTLDFLRDKVVPNLGNMYHIARKKIPCYDEDKKETIKPESNNGIKLESFIFDVFPLSTKMAVLDVVREDEFAPVKNAPGSHSDSPDTARALISNQAKRWVRASRGEVLPNDGGDDDAADAICEISPLTSYAGEGLEEIVSGKSWTCPFAI